MKCFAPLSSTVHFPTVSTRLLCPVRQSPVKSAVHKFVTSKGPAAPNDALRDAGNVRNSPGIARCRQLAGSPVPITFVTPAIRTFSASIHASNHVRSGTPATTVPPSADRVAFITVANVAARRHARRVPSRVHGRALISRARFLAGRYVSYAEYTPLPGC